MIPLHSAARRRLLGAAAIASVVLAPGSADTEVDVGEVMIYGFGAQSCANWLASQAQGNAAVSAGFLGWVGGYLSAVNAWTKGEDVLKDSNFQAAIAWIDSFCRDNPKETVALAAREFVLARTGDGSQGAPVVQGNPRREPAIDP